MIRLLKAWWFALKPWPKIEDAPLGYVHNKREPYIERSGRWLA